MESGKTRRLSWRLGLLALAAFFGPASPVRADGTVAGTVRFERFKNTGVYWTDLHEWNAYLTPSGSMFANPISYRCDHGAYSITSPAGNYTLYVNRPEVFARPKLVTGVQILNGQTRTINPTFNLDYSAYWKHEWPAGWDHTWYQTFIATGTSINKIAYCCAGSDASSIAVTLLKDTGGNVINWTPVGETKSSGTSIGENWVGHRSGKLPTTPGERYAIRLVGQGSTPSFSPYWHTDAGDGYADGQAFDRFGNGLDKDLCILVFSDNDGTVIPYMKTTGSMGAYAGWEWQWGQTFKATGTSLAAVDHYFTSGSDWNMQMTFAVYATPPDGQGGPPSSPVGLVKRGRGAWEPSAGCMGVSYAPGEVPLTPGHTYYIEMTPYGGPIGFNPFAFNEPADAYPDGHAYGNRIGRSSVDLSMTIMEYVDPPRIERAPASFTRTVPRGGTLPDDSFTVRNSGSDFLSYQITPDVGWIEVSPAKGFSVSETDTVSLAYHPGGLAMGSYTGTITVADPRATNSPQLVQVYLTVTPPPFAPCDYDTPPDGDVDVTDFGHLQSCLTGPGISIQDSSCTDASLDGDDDADNDDVQLFIRCFRGAGVPADPLCADPQ